MDLCLYHNRRLTLPVTRLYTSHWIVVVIRALECYMKCVLLSTVQPLLLVYYSLLTLQKSVQESILYGFVMDFHVLSKTNLHTFSLFSSSVSLCPLLDTLHIMFATALFVCYCRVCYCSFSSPCPVFMRHGTFFVLFSP